MRRQVFFLDATGGGRFCLVSWPDGVPLGGLVQVHPFAEELNKSRRMVALGTQALVERGWVVLQMDLFGCGDSSGDFGQASWVEWLADVSRAWAWLATQCPAPLVLWTMRAGSLLAADWLAKHDGPSPALLMWQPVNSGKQHFTQFLRLKAASEMLADADAKTAMAEIRAQLHAGHCVEVAGYAISPYLAAGMEASTLRLPVNYGAKVGILEVCSGDRVEPSPAMRMLTERWESSGIDVELAAVSGPSFWQTQEIEIVPALIERSAAWLDRLLP